MLEGDEGRAGGGGGGRLGARCARGPVFTSRHAALIPSLRISPRIPCHFWSLVYIIIASAFAAPCGALTTAHVTTLCTPRAVDFLTRCANKLTRGDTSCACGTEHDLLNFVPHTALLAAAPSPGNVLLLKLSRGGTSTATCDASVTHVGGTRGADVRL